MREFVIKLNDKDYHDFLRVSNEYGLTVEEKIYEIIGYYLLIERKPHFFTQKIKACKNFSGVIKS